MFLAIVGTPLVSISPILDFTLSENKKLACLLKNHFPPSSIGSMSKQVAIVRNSEYQMECISLFQQQGITVKSERANAMMAVEE